MDLLVLADQNGVVDMTQEAIARRTNVPLATVVAAIQQLEAEDIRSRSNAFRGVRMKRIDDHRDWGWVIVNYDKYRAIANAEAYRQVTREKVQAIRSRESNPPPTPPLKSEADSKAEAEAYSGNVVHVITSNNNSVFKGKSGHSEVRKPFTRPCVDDMISYGESLDPKLPLSECLKCFNYYESNGWKVGRNPMKDWKAAMVNWRSNWLERNNENRPRTNKQNPRNAGIATDPSEQGRRIAAHIAKQQADQKSG